MNSKKYISCAFSCARPSFLGEIPYELRDFVIFCFVMRYGVTQLIVHSAPFKLTPNIIDKFELTPEIYIGKFV